MSRKWRATTIVFDLDGVLIDSGRDIANAVNFTLETLGLPKRPVEQIVSFIGPGAEGILRKSLGSAADSLIDQALPIYKARYNEYCVVETTVYPGIPAMLSQLKSAGKAMAVATNKMEAFTHRILDGLGISQYFDLIIGAESVTRRKPDPQAINLILASLQVPPEKTIVVGDATTDIQAAKAAGTISCGATYGLGSVEEITGAHPDFIINEASELPAYIE